MPQTSPRVVVLACAVFRHELDRLAPPGARVIYLRQSLHRTPHVMAEAIQMELDRIAPGSVDKVVLAYGLCSNGIVGVKATRGKLLVPRSHDCIALFLGSYQKYREEHRKAPGTYYLTPGWIEEKKDPLGVMQEYTERISPEDAEWCMREELKNYTRVVLVDTGLISLEPFRPRTRENADFFGLAYEELQGSQRLLETLFSGEPEEHFFVLQEGETVTSDRFLAL
jgi:hypothetical protein